MGIDKKLWKQTGKMVKNIATKIVEAKADYVLGLKGNQGKLLEDVKLYMDILYKGGLKQVKKEHNETIEKGYENFNA